MLWKRVFPIKQIVKALCSVFWHNLDVDGLHMNTTFKRILFIERMAKNQFESTIWNKNEKKNNHHPINLFNELNIPRHKTLL